MLVINISDPQNPILISSYNSMVSKVKVLDNYAYLNGEQFKILDVRDPSNPEEVGSLDLCVNNLDILEVQHSLSLVMNYT